MRVADSRGPGTGQGPAIGRPVFLDGHEVVFAGGKPCTNRAVARWRGQCASRRESAPDDDHAALVHRIHEDDHRRVGPFGPLPVPERLDGRSVKVMTTPVASFVSEIERQIRDVTALIERALQEPSGRQRAHAEDVAARRHAVGLELAVLFRPSGLRGAACRSGGAVSGIERDAHAGDATARTAVAIVPSNSTRPLTRGPAASGTIRSMTSRSPTAAASARPAWRRRGMGGGPDGGGRAGRRSSSSPDGVTRTCRISSTFTGGRGTRTTRRTILSGGHRGEGKRAVRVRDRRRHVERSSRRRVTAGTKPDARSSATGRPGPSGCRTTRTPRSGRTCRSMPPRSSPDRIVDGRWPAPARAAAG